MKNTKKYYKVLEGKHKGRVGLFCGTVTGTTQRLYRLEFNDSRCDSLGSEVYDFMRNRITEATQADYDASK